MTKRKIYLSLSFLLPLLILWFAIFVAGEQTSIKASILAGLGTFVGSYLMLVLLNLCALMTGKHMGRADVRGNKQHPNHGQWPLTPTFGFLTLRYKRIYYAGLGYFWTELRDEKVHVYEQKYLLCNEMFSIDYDGDIERLRDKIKSNLTYRFKEKLRKSKDADKFNNWNGYLDKRSERNGKINEIVD